MLVETRALGFGLWALGPFGGRVLKVTVRLEDVNAGRGGIDKRSSVVAAVRRRGVVVAQAIRDDLYSAIHEAAARIRSSMSRQITRHVGRERSDPQRPGAMVAH